MVGKTFRFAGFLLLLSFPLSALADDDLIADVLLRPEEKKEEKKVTETAIGQLLDDVNKSEVGFVPPDDPSLEYPEEDKFYTPEAIDDYKFELLLESILTDTELDIPDPVNINEGDPWRDWGKDSFFIDADINKMIVNKIEKSDNNISDKIKDIQENIESDDLINQIDEIQDYMNSDEYKKKIQDAQEKAESLFGN